MFWVESVLHTSQARGHDIDMRYALHGPGSETFKQRALVRVIVRASASRAEAVVTLLTLMLYATQIHVFLSDSDGAH